MKIANLVKLTGASAAAFFTFTVAAPAQTPGLVLLDGLKKGAWVLKPRGSTEESERVCLGDPKKLLQIKHSGASCSRYVIEDGPQNLRVSYKCGGLGHGVTTIRGESSGLVQIQSQGIENNAPFSLSVEARHVGSC
ncbi:MAG: hypothetical protein Pars2KO_21810 [Parasphingorhabdus sp.]